MELVLVFVSCFVNADKMHEISKWCVILIWVVSFTVVTGQDCTISNFNNDLMSDSNFDTIGMEETYSNEKQIIVPCKVGFTGLFKIRCSGGNWTKVFGDKCTPKSCGHPGESLNADFTLVSGTDFVFTSVVEYNCHEGYIMVSRNANRRCLDQGWSGNTPTCEAIKCPEITVDENVLVTGNRLQSSYGNVLQFGCRNKSLALYGPLHIRCEGNGQWNEGPPKCDVVKCKVPDIANGRVDNTEYAEGQYLTITCNPGYSPSERRPQCVNIHKRSGWSQTPLCERVTCQLLQETGTTYLDVNKDRFIPGETVLVKCNQGHWFSYKQTQKTITCTESGEWDTTAICQGDGHGAVVARVGEDVTLPCFYNVVSYGALGVCWGRGPIPKFGCSNEVLWTDGRALRRLSERYRLHQVHGPGDISLTLVHVQESDAGVYGCRVAIPGPFNDQIHETTLRVVAVPPHPVRLEVGQVGEKTIRVGWSPGLDVGRPITGYRIDYKDLTASWEQAMSSKGISPSLTEVTLVGMRPNKAYTIRMFAVNSEGLSEPSNVLTVTTKESTPEGPPLDVKVEALTSSSLRITWKPPSVELRNGVLRGYIIRYREYVSATQWGEWHHQNVASTADPGSMVLNDLRPATQYSVLIAAMTIAGPGSAFIAPLCSTLAEGENFENIDPLKNFPPPSTVKQVKQFLSMSTEGPRPWDH